MANASPKDIRLRVEALLQADPRIQSVIEDDTCPLDDADLPAVLVMIRQGANTRSASNSSASWRQATRTVQIGAYLTRLCGDSLEEQRTQLLAAEALLDVIPDIFSRVDRLRLGGDALGGVMAVSEMTDDGLETRVLGEDVYYAGTYEFTVTVKRS